MSTNNRISSIVSTQTPFFVQNDHQNFIKFLEAYYEYLEQNGKVVDASRNLQNYIDLDATDEYADQLFNKFMKLMPRDMLADKSMVMKNIKDFYRAKGTEKSIEFLMSALYGQDTTFYYPKRDVFIASGAKWFIEKSIRVGGVKIQGVANTDIVGLRKFTNTKVRGNTSNASAVIESVDVFFENGVIVNELKLSAQENDFISGEEIFTYFDEEGEAKTISATIFSGILNDVIVTVPGYGYKVGDDVVVESNTGNGAIVKVSAVSNGRLKTIAALEGGAGFQQGDYLLITGGGGAGGNASTQRIRADGYFHPNSYNVVGTTIDLVSNTILGNISWGANLSGNINTTIANAVTYWTYANTGPVETIRIYSSGDNYTSIPNLDIIANTRIRTLGILGKMNVVSGGTGYQIGDRIEFEVPTFGTGTGAAAQISNVAANGAITKVDFIEVPGHIIGGSGYTNALLPKANIISATGSNGNVVVTTVLGDGEALTATTDDIGQIISLTIQNRGLGYETPPTLNLSNSGDGTAQAYATIITGIYTYPGRYVADDSIVSGYSFIQNRDYYQNFSYVVKVSESINKYRKALKDLVHPVGMKLFGEYLYYNNDQPAMANGVSIATANTQQIVIKLYEDNVIARANTLNVYNWFGTAPLVNSAISIDSDEVSPIGGVVVKLQTGKIDPYVSTLGGVNWNLASANVGEVWQMRFFVKANNAGQIETYMAPSRANGQWLTAHQAFHNVSSDWVEVVRERQLTHPNTEYIQVRFDGQSGANMAYWIDGLQVRKIS